MGTTSPPDFHFPTEIALSKNPLVEAWLEVRWRLTPGELPNSMVDSGFPFALGVFYNSIKDEFGFKEPLPASFAPEEMLPHMARFRFRKQPNTWPVLQFGPGIATANFTSPYTWEEFRAKSLYLREKIIGAYTEGELSVQNLILRYRNAIEFDYASSDLLDFLATRLNLSVQPPQHIPGGIAKTSWPNEINASIIYDLTIGRGIIKFATGFQKPKGNASNQVVQKRVIIFELEIQSLNTDDRHWASEDAFNDWLTSAHSVIHEWFFALIDGPLRSEYGNGDK